MKSNSIFVLMILFAFVACKQKAAEVVPVTPDITLPLVSILTTFTDTTVFVGAKVTVKGRIVGTPTEFGFKVNGAPVTNTGTQSLPIYEASSATPSSQVITLYAKNERGTVEKTVKVNFIAVPIPVTKFLHNDSEKTWKLVSVKFNDTDEMIRDYEKDDLLIIYATSKMDGTKTYNYTYNVGTLVSGPLAEKTTNGLWKVTGETLLELKPLHTSPVYMTKIDEDNLVYRFSLSPNSKVYYYYKKVK